MRWEDERYVRVYTRDTVDWLALSFEAQGLLTLILRKVDRAGILVLGKHGKRAVAVALGHAARWDVIAPALEELLADGCVRIEGETLVFRNFIEAQEATMSDRQRKAEQRARARDRVCPVPDKPSRSVTDCPESVTRGHAASHAVTPSCAVPCRTEPEKAAAAARAREEPPAPEASPVVEAPPPPGPARRARPVAFDDDRPTPPRLLVVDHVELGPLGAEWRGRLEVALGHGLAAPAEEKRAEVADELEERLAQEGVDRAVAWVTSTVEARRRSGGDEPGSVTLCLLILRSIPKRVPSPLERVRASCPEWAQLLEAVQALPFSDRPDAHQLDRWFLPLSASFARGVLTLEAPDDVHVAFFTGEYLGGLRELAAHVLGPHVTVHVVLRALLAVAGGAA